MTEHPHPDDDPRLGALLEWRQRLIDSGAVSARSFKEAHLRLVLRSGRTDVEQIRAMLPGSVSEHADDMARVLAELPVQPPEETTSADAPAGRHRGEDPPPADPPAPPPLSEPLPESSSGTDEFAAYVPSAPTGPTHSVTLHRRRDTGALELRWPPADATGATVVYRVVSGEDAPPRSPETGDLLAVTTETSATDDRRRWRRCVTSRSGRTSAPHVPKLSPRNRCCTPAGC